MSSRIDKLEYSKLDQALSRSFHANLEQSLKPLTPSFKILDVMKAEIRFLTGCFIFWNTIGKNSTSIGQALYNLQYYGTKDKKSGITSQQATILFVFTICLPYLRERFFRSKIFRNKFTYELEELFKVLEFANFLVFLHKGSYPNLISRVLRLGCDLSPGKKRIQVDVSLTNRNMLWNIMSEILSSFLQLSDHRKVRAILRRSITYGLFSTKPTNQSSREEKDYQVCGICGDWPCNPHHIGCRHVFCYFCIQQDYLRGGTEEYSCPVCSYKVARSSQIKQLFMTWNG
ncbi:peroxisome biogenesis factor 2-like [Brevipalpus obovatus]|uniref:peroxisome biogenesis factor 2-like n=1 Tax=Brevipalpus obovatus TaxID=246614 RepID=UPI003D9F4864